MKYLESNAKFSEDQKFRYWLYRRWSSKPLVLFIGLNPSTANANDDDPTIRRIVRFAEGFGYGGVYMMNVFPLVSPFPEHLRDFIDTPFYDIEEDLNFSMIKEKKRNGKGCCVCMGKLQGGYGVAY